jgi:hypothetical protein
MVGRSIALSDDGPSTGRSGVVPGVRRTDAVSANVFVVASARTEFRTVRQTVRLSRGMGWAGQKCHMKCILYSVTRLYTFSKMPLIRHIRWWMSLHAGGRYRPTPWAFFRRRRVSILTPAARRKSYRSIKRLILPSSF